MTNMTKAQLEERMAKLEAELKAEKAKSESVKVRIENALASGINDMDVLVAELGVGRKSLSSNLTRLRKEMQLKGQTIITQQHEGRTRLAVISISHLGWDKPSTTLSNERVPTKEEIATADRILDEMDKLTEIKRVPEDKGDFEIPKSE